MKKTIALCGAHGTGKTTLLKLLEQQYKLTPLTRTVRTFWEDSGVVDFEKLPMEVRNIFQKHLLLNQITQEDEAWKNGFITERSVLDYIGYTVVSSDMQGVEKRMFEFLVRERLRRYDVFVYLPVEFPAKAEYLRAHPGLQKKVATVLELYLSEWLEPHQYCIARGSVKERFSQIQSFIDGDNQRY